MRSVPGGYDDLPGVWVDPVLVPQLFDNLIGNARKYVAAGVAPQVRIEAAVSNDWARVRVIDNGVGLPEHFAVAHATGLGLSNTMRRLVQLYGDSQSFDIARAERGTPLCRTSISVRTRRCVATHC